MYRAPAHSAQHQAQALPGQQQGRAPSRRPASSKGGKEHRPTSAAAEDRVAGAAHVGPGHQHRAMVIRGHRQRAHRSDAGGSARLTKVQPRQAAAVGVGKHGLAAQLGLATELGVGCGVGGVFWLEGHPPLPPPPGRQVVPKPRAQGITAGTPARQRSTGISGTRMHAQEPGRRRRRSPACRQAGRAVPRRPGREPPQPNHLQAAPTRRATAAPTG